MHNTKSWFLGCGEWTLSHLQDQQQKHKRNLRELQYVVGETLPKGSWKSIRVGCKRENYSSTVNNELPIRGLDSLKKLG